MPKNKSVRFIPKNKTLRALAAANTAAKRKAIFNGLSPAEQQYVIARNARKLYLNPGAPAFFPTPLNPAAEPFETEAEVMAGLRTAGSKLPNWLGRGGGRSWTRRRQKSQRLF